eukprot:493711_1
MATNLLNVWKMNFVILMILFLTSNNVKSESVNIKPSTIFNDNYNINIKIDSNQVTQTSSTWSMTTSSSTNQWALEMEVNSNKFQFTTSMSSTFTVAIYGSCITSKCDLFTTFGTKNNYFSFATDLDGSLVLNNISGIHIHPKCGSNLIRENMTNSFFTTFNESNWNNLSNINNGINNYNWPLIFEVNNKP